ncbi:winged helix-turn-helix transcriptional regulator [Niallia circulans]
MSILQSGTPTYLKIINKRKVLQEIIEGNKLYSRASLAKRLKLSKPTISALVDELVEEGWIIEKESKKAAKKGGENLSIYCLPKNTNIRLALILEERRPK